MLRATPCRANTRLPSASSSTYTKSKPLTVRAGLSLRSVSNFSNGNKTFSTLVNRSVHAAQNGHKVQRRSYSTVPDRKWVIESLSSDALHSANIGLTEDQVMLRETALKFAQEKMEPFAAGTDASGDFICLLLSCRVGWEGNLSSGNLKRSSSNGFWRYVHTTRLCSRCADVLTHDVFLRRLCERRRWWCRTQQSWCCSYFWSVVVCMCFYHCIHFHSQVSHLSFLSLQINMYRV